MTDRGVQCGFRLPTDLVEWIDDEARRLSPPGAVLSRTDVVKIALSRVRSMQREGRDPLRFEPSPPAPRPATETPTHKRLLQRLREGDLTQAQIAEAADIDTGLLSRFKTSGRGLSPESLNRLRKVLA